MNIYKQIAIWAAMLSPLVLVLGYFWYEMRKSWKIRKRNKKRLAAFNQIIAEALKQER